MTSEQKPSEREWRKWEPNLQRYGVFELTPELLAYLQGGGILSLNVAGFTALVEWPRVPRETSNG